MPITAARMISLVNSAIEYMDSFKALAGAIDRALERPDSLQALLDLKYQVPLLRPSEEALQTIAVERAYFKKNKEALRKNMEAGRRFRAKATT